MILSINAKKPFTSIAFYVYPSKGTGKSLSIAKTSPVCLMSLSVVIKTCLRCSSSMSETEEKEVSPLLPTEESVGGMWELLTFGLLITSLALLVTLLVTLATPPFPLSPWLDVSPWMPLFPLVKSSATFF